MAPGEDCPTSAKKQPPGKIFWRQHGARRPRRRFCLLKGCGRVFRPQQPMARYCSEACQAEARRWRQWKGRRRYRQSANGKEKRRAQSRRLSSTPKGAASARKRCPHRREGHPYEIFFGAPVIGRVATRSSNAPGDRPCSGSVPTPAATPWNGFWSGSDAGAKDARVRPGREPGGRRPCLSADKSLPRSSGHIALGLPVSLSSACAQQGEEGGVRPTEVGVVSLSLLLRSG